MMCSMSERVGRDRWRRWRGIVVATTMAAVAVLGTEPGPSWGAEAEGDPEDVLEARELAALNHERLAQGRSLGDLHDELSGHGCGCCSQGE